MPLAEESRPHSRAPLRELSAPEVRAQEQLHSPRQCRNKRSFATRGQQQEPPALSQNWVLPPAELVALERKELLAQLQPSGSAVSSPTLGPASHSLQRQPAMLVCSPPVSPPELVALPVQRVSQRLLALVLAWQVLVPALQPVAQEQQPEPPALRGPPCAAVRARRAAFLWPAQC